MISQRAQSIDSSGIRRMFDLAATLQDPINLSIGVPSFDALVGAKEAAKIAIDMGRNGYTVTQGIPELREHLRVRYGIGSRLDARDVDVFITSGVSGGLFLSYAALLDPGDEILIPDPYFGMYRDLARLLSAVPVCYDTYPDFALRVSQLETVVTPRTKAVLVNSPCNPTGYALSQSELDDVVEFVRLRKLWLIYDEIYSLFTYDAPHAECFGKYDRTIVLNGFSKSHGVPGWRVGYAVGPTEVIQAMLKIQQYSFVCAPSVAQWGLLSVVDEDLDQIREEYRRKRDFVVDALRDRYEFITPGGAFYLFPKAPGGESGPFLQRCIAEKLLVVQGSVFSRRDTHFRISFSVAQDQLERGVHVLRRLS